MTHRTVRTVSIIVLLVTAAVILTAFLRRNLAADGLIEVDSGPLMMMGTFGRIRVRCQDRIVGQQALGRALAVLRDVDRLMSTYRDDSELSNVNRLAGRQPVAVSAETFALLQKAIEYSRLTDGAFDVSVTPLLDLWKRTAKENRLPTDDELADAIKHVGWRKLTLGGVEARTVRFNDPGMQLNVDAIAKGYAVDRALEALRQGGVAAGLVEIGGEIACFGRQWVIGIQDPFANENDDPLSQQPRWRVRLQNGAAATSGNYRRYMTIAGTKLSHIVDPRTGRPADALPSVTVIASKAVDADALATAVSVMGPEKGLKLIESLSNTEAFLAAGTPDNVRIYRSTGFSEYEIQPTGTDKTDD